MIEHNDGNRIWRFDPCTLKRNKYNGFIGCGHAMDDFARCPCELFIRTSLEGRSTFFAFLLPTTPFEFEDEGCPLPWALQGIEAVVRSLSAKGKLRMAGDQLRACHCASSSWTRFSPKPWLGVQSASFEGRFASFLGPILVRAILHQDDAGRQAPA